jgi:23S rRNA pseudouridine955/2504/2580 synthase
VLQTLNKVYGIAMADRRARHPAPGKPRGDADVTDSNPAGATGGGVRYLTVGQEPGQRIDNFLLRELKGLPRSRIYSLLRKGEVRVNGGRVKPTHRLAAGDRVRIPPLRGVDPGEPSGASTAFIGTGILDVVERAIIHEDDDLLVVNKPAGMPVHGGSGLSFGAIEALRRLRPNAELGLAHRLDRDTSGCLLVGKSRRVLLELHRALREREVKKRYLVAVFGEWPRRVTTVQLALERYVTGSGERRVRVSAGGKASRTDFRIVERGADATLLQARLHTGRTHQIRVHARATGHPVVGDVKYSSPLQQARAAELGIYRLCLHAEELVVVRAGRKLKFEAPVPDDFTAAWTRLRSGAGR